ARNLFQLRQSCDHRFVDRPCALRTTKHQERKLSRLASLRRYVKKLSPHGIARHFRWPAKVRQRLFKRNRRTIDKARQHPVGPTRQRIRFHHQRASIRQRRSQHNRTRNITPSANNHVRLKLSQQLPRRNKALRQDRESFHTCAETHVFQPGTFNEHQLKTSLRHQPRFQSARGADELHFRIRIAPHDLLGHRNPRINVSTCASGSDQYSHWRLPMFPLACCDTLSRMPTAASVGTRDEPPYEMNGSGIPFVGTSESTTLILKSACATMLVTIPRLNNIPNRSGASNAVRTPRQRKSPNTATIASAPTRPSSSPTTAKMKSECANGRNSIFCLPCAKPRPFVPPEPTAINDWTTWNPEPC